jgi:hypothetical protein
MAVLAGADLGDGVAAGGVAGGAPVVAGERADGAVQLDRPADCVQVVRQTGCAALLDGPPVALGGDRGCGLALLGDLEAAAGDRVQQRRLAVGAGVLPQADGVLGDEAVAVELGQPVEDRGASERSSARAGCPLSHSTSSSLLVKPRGFGTLE